MLSLRDVHFHIGKLHILQGVSLEVKEGECAALLGRNGVGKTTTLRCIMGLVARSHGVIEFHGDDLSKSPPHLIPRKGIGYVPQGRGIFPTLSVLENLTIGVPGMRDDEQQEYVLSCFPRLKERAKQLAGSMSGGEQQMLALARALMLAPKILLVDEPSVGLAPILVARTIDAIKTLKDSFGLTVLMAEQNFTPAVRIANRGYVIVHGKIIFEGNSADELNTNDLIRKFYMGL